MTISIAGKELKKDTEISAALTALIATQSARDIDTAFGHLPGLMQDGIGQWGVRKKHVAEILTYYSGVPNSQKLLEVVKFAVQHPRFLGAVAPRHIKTIGDFLMKRPNIEEIAALARGIQGQTDLAAAFVPTLQNIVALVLTKPQNDTPSNALDILTRAVASNSVMERVVAQANRPTQTYKPGDMKIGK